MTFREMEERIATLEDAEMRLVDLLADAHSYTTPTTGIHEEIAEFLFRRRNETCDCGYCHFPGAGAFCRCGRCAAVRADWKKQDHPEGER